MTKTHIDSRPYAWPWNGALRADNTALVIIDMQRDFVEPGGFGESLGNTVEPLQAIVPTIAHVLAAWLALWAVAVLAIVLLRGLTRHLAQNLMTGLDAWSAHVARRRADERLWAMAQSDPRLMSDLQVAMDRAPEAVSPVRDLETLMTRRAARLVRDRLYYI